MFIFLQFVMLLTASVVITSFFSEKKLKLFLSFLFGLFFSLQIGSVLTAGNLIDYKVFFHLNDDIWKVKGFFTFQILIFFISIAISVFTIYYLSGKWKSVNKYGKKLNFTALVCISFILSINDGVLNKLFTVAELNLTEDKEFTQALKDLGINPSEYTTPENIKASAGKNIIVISLESFEKAYLSEKFTHLTPNMSQMAKELTFFEMLPAPGSDWTAGSIYCEITGLPSFFKNSTNHIFQNATTTKVLGLGNILTKAGYELSYLMGGADFGGVRDMLKANQFTVKSDKDFTVNYEITP